jgi:polyhydroxyalkanoate synthase subunit PhaC
VLIVWLALFVAFVTAVAVGSWWLAPRDTARERIEASGLRRAARSLRGTAVTAVANVAGWPHYIEVLAGAYRREEMPRLDTRVVWRAGKAALTHLPGDGSRKTPVLVVHSMVSQPTILDLTESRSLVRQIQAAGYDTFLLDWGDYDADEAAHGLAEHTALLREAEEFVRATSRSGRVQEIAYCLAGMLAVESAAGEPKPWLNSLIAIAPPFDLGVPGGLQPVLSHRWLRPALLLDGNGCVPAAVVREAFHALRPQAIRTVWARIRYAKRMTAEDKDFHAAMAHWSWEQRSLPGALFFDLIDLFRSNELLATGNRDLLHKLGVPMLLVIAERDHIVPSGSSHALTTVVGKQVTVRNVAAGHVSMVVGRAARETVWPALLEWLATHDAKRRR